MNNETRADQLQIEENKKKYDKRNTSREELITKLSDLLDEIIRDDSVFSRINDTLGFSNNREVILSRLNELGLKTEQSFINKSTEEMRISICELITYLKELSNGVLKVSNSDLQNENQEKI